MKIKIDNGHGDPPLTGGKHSPDNKLKEYVWAREIATRVVDALKKKGYDAERLVPEDKDIPLNERVRRVNNACRQYGSQNVLCVSIHINAAGSDGKWHNATGWCGFVAPNASSKSKRLAQILYKEAEIRGLQGNRSVPAEKYWVKSLAMCRDTNCPAVLTENLFMDNEGEAAWLQTETGKQAIVDLHVNGIIKYIAQYGNK